jgi:hypothetical protein
MRMPYKRFLYVRRQVLLSARTLAKVKAQSGLPTVIML